MSDHPANDGIYSAYDCPTCCNGITTERLSGLSLVWVYPTYGPVAVTADPSTAGDTLWASDALA